MKVSELKAEDIELYARIDRTPEDRKMIEQILLPGAIEHICGRIGMKKQEMDEHPDLVIAVCALVADMYDHRSMTAETDRPNKTVDDIIEKYARNLIPRVQP